MDDLRIQAKTILVSELSKKGIEIWEKLNDRERVHFATKSKNGSKNRLYLEVLNLDKQRSIKINKQFLGVPKENLWVVLVVFISNGDPLPFLIPSKVLEKPDDNVFLENDLGNFKHLSNYEIKVFVSGIEEKLGEYTIYNQIENLL
jgi:hypothetical protein